MLRLRTPTPPGWTQVVLAGFDAFLADHACCEYKAVSSAMSLLSRYPDHPGMVEPLIAFCREEMEHFHRMVRVLEQRGLRWIPGAADRYAEALMKHVRKSEPGRLLDRLLVPAIIEARSCERFMLLLEALPPGEIKDLYEDLTRSEARHHGFFLRLARNYFPAEEIQQRLDELLDAEDAIIRSFPLIPAVH
ncbi:MAG: hypothetical protein GMKNLPBB_03395 [Myxococcota bacterium]|nr:hypothetical protein [Myxococcota bacterium]